MLYPFSPRWLRHTGVVVSKPSAMTLGINRAQSRDDLMVPERYRIEIAVAIGTRADPSALSQDLRDREQPSQRLALNEISFAGAFPG